MQVMDMSDEGTQKDNCLSSYNAVMDFFGVVVDMCIKYIRH